MRWPTQCRSPKMSWKNSRRLLLKLVSHTLGGGHSAPLCCTFELDLSHCCDEQQCQQDVDILLLSWLSLCQGVPWQLCCFWLVTLAKEHRGRDTGSLAIGSAGRQPCALRWAVLLPDGRRNPQTGIALLWPWQHFRACTVLGSGGVGLADWLSHVHGQCRCCISGLHRCILKLVSKSTFVYLAIMQRLVVITESQDQ